MTSSTAAPAIPVAVTALDFLRRATDFLAARGVDNPRLDAEVLLADVLGVNRVGVYLNFDRPLGEAEVQRYRESIRRRGRREPLQHVRGRQEFWSRDFAVDGRALVPRGDSETLIAAALELAKPMPAPRILDLGTGSGILAVTLALEIAGASVVATDVSDDALALARANATELGVAERIDFRAGDLFAPVAGETFDLVISNPPYVPSAAIQTLEPEVRDHDPRLALDGGADGLDVLRRIVAVACSHLAAGGSLALEIGNGQSGAMTEMLSSACFTSIAVRRDLSGVERVITGRNSP